MRKTLPEPVSEQTPGHVRGPSPPLHPSLPSFLPIFFIDFLCTFLLLLLFFFFLRLSFPLLLLFLSYENHKRRIRDVFGAFRKEI